HGHCPFLCSSCARISRLWVPLFAARLVSSDGPFTAQCLYVSPSTYTRAHRCLASQYSTFQSLETLLRLCSISRDWSALKVTGSGAAAPFPYTSLKPSWSRCLH